MSKGHRISTNIYNMIFLVKWLNNEHEAKHDMKWSMILFDCLTRGKPWYKWFVTWSHAISHVGGWLLYGSLRVIPLQPIFKLCNISYLRVLFHSSWMFLTFWDINHKKIKGKECIHVTIFAQVMRSVSIWFTVYNTIITALWL